MKSNCKMKIETRFRLWDAVYFMHENEPRASMIQGAMIDIDANGNVHVWYQLENFSRFFKEEELAESRDELQKKFFGK